MRSGRQAPCLIEFWLSPAMEMPPPLWTEWSALLHHCGENIFSSWVFLCCSCPLLLVLCNSKKSQTVFSVPSDYLAADSNKALPFLILNKPNLSFSQLSYLRCFCKRCRWSRGLLAYQLISCFLRWKEIFTGIVPIGERLLRLSRMFQITSFNIFSLQTFIYLVSDFYL